MFIMSGNQTNVNFGYLPPAPVTRSVSGKVYDDADNSGSFTAGDSGLAGVTVKITCNSTDYTALTAADGTYSITGIPDGVTCTAISNDATTLLPSYTATETPKLVFPLTMSGNPTNVNFGYLPPAPNTFDPPFGRN